MVETNGNHHTKPTKEGKENLLGGNKLKGKKLIIRTRPKWSGKLELYPGLANCRGIGLGKNGGSVCWGKGENAAKNLAG